MTIKNIGIIFLFLIIVLANSCQEENLPEVIADFNASKTTILVGDKIQFTDLSDGMPSSWQWIFEGGNPEKSSDQNPEVSYAVKGHYKVTLMASNKKNSDAETKETFITVLPLVDASFSASATSINQGTNVLFTDNSIGDPTSWNWTFPGGNPSNSTEQNPSVLFTSAGRQMITLTISNELSASSTSLTVLVLPTDGLVTYFPFKGNSNDLSGNNNNGVVEGASLTTDRFNNTNDAYTFDGIDDQIIIHHIEEFDNLPMSISFWVNFSELKSSILGIDNFDNYQSGVWFSVGQSAETLGRLAVSFGNGGTPPGPDKRKTFLTNEALNINSWYHVVGVVTNNTLKIYVNGAEEVGAYSGTGTTHVNTQHNGSIGRVWDPNTFFKGKIDDFRIYNRSLTSEEVGLLFDEH